jgi:predicted nucleic acid-binding protein
VKCYVLDASALIALLADEPGAATVQSVLLQVEEGRCQAQMSVVNWGEVYYFLLRNRHPGASRLQAVPVSLIDADTRVARLAAKFKAHNQLPYVDAFAAAAAIQAGGTLLTCDADFHRVEDQVDIRWLASK